MPRRAPFDPQGYYHVGTRGCYGRTMFADVVQHELFLLMHGRISRKYGIVTLAWALVKNHHHFVVELTNGGLSEAMRELHGGYSRRINQIEGQTRKGHLVRHAFFARELKSEGDVFLTCAYVDLNASTARPGVALEDAPWNGYAATIGLEHPRPFHRPSELLRLISPKPDVARATYRDHVQGRLALRSLSPSPNDEVRRVVESDS